MQVARMKKRCNKVHSVLYDADGAEAEQVLSSIYVKNAAAKELGEPETIFVLLAGSLEEASKALSMVLRGNEKGKGAK